MEVTFKVRTKDEKEAAWKRAFHTEATARPRAFCVPGTDKRAGGGLKIMSKRQAVQSGAGEADHQSMFKSLF